MTDFQGMSVTDGTALNGTAGEDQRDRLDALFAGTIFCDLVFGGVPNPEAGTEVYADAFALSPGGAANRAVAAARLGLQTALLAEMGSDPLGRAIRAVLSSEANLHLDYVTEQPGLQSPVTVSMTSEDDRRFVTYVEEQADLCWPASLPGLRMAHVNVGHPLPHWSAALRARGTVFFGGVGWDETGRWDRAVLDRLHEVDVFVPNDVEAMNYSRTSTPTEAAVALGAHVPLVVVTRGREGAVAHDRETGEVTEVPAVLVQPRDPTGAGDVFVASLMASHERGWTLRERLSFACLGASLSVQSLGGAASAPRPAALRDFLLRTRPPGEWDTVLDWLGGQIDPDTTNTASMTSTASTTSTTTTTTTSTSGTTAEAIPAPSRPS